MMGDLHESEKQWLHTQMRKYGPVAAVQTDVDGYLRLCAEDAVRFIRLTEQLLLLHDEECERRLT